MFGFSGLTWMNPYVLSGIGQKLPSGYDFMLLINETDYSVQIRLKSHNIKNRSLLQARVSLVAAILNVKYVVNRGQPQYETRNDRELIETLLAVILFLQIRERSSNLNKIPVPSAKKSCFFFHINGRSKYEIRFQSKYGTEKCSETGRDPFHYLITIFFSRSKVSPYIELRTLLL